MNIFHLIKLICRQLMLHAEVGRYIRFTSKKRKQHRTKGGSIWWGCGL